MITGLVGVWILPENETMRTRSIRVSSINPKYRSQNGALYNKKMTTLIWMVWIILMGEFASGRWLYR